MEAKFFLFSSVHATLQPALSVRRSVRPSVRPSIGPSIGSSIRHTLLFYFFYGLWPHCSCPNDMVTLITAPAHPHATGVAVYPAVSGEIKWAGRLGSNESRVIGKTILMLLHTSCCILAVRNRLSQTGCCTPAVANWSCTPVVAYQLLHTGYCTLTFAYSTFRANSTKTGE